jgi:hypothetical protein
VGLPEPRAVAAALPGRNLVVRLKRHEGARRRRIHQELFLPRATRNEVRLLKLVLHQRQADALPLHGIACRVNARRPDRQI